MTYILVVEDDEASGALMRRIFERANYQVACFPSAHEALESSYAAPPLLAIVDVRLPLNDGFWLVEQMKSDALLQKVPIVLLTADTNHETRDKAAMLGCDLFIPKPFSPRDLLKSVEHLLPHAAPEL